MKKPTTGTDLPEVFLLKHNYIFKRSEEKINGAMMFRLILMISTGDIRFKLFLRS